MQVRTFAMFDQFLRMIEPCHCSAQHLSHELQIGVAVLIWINRFTPT